MRPLTLLLAGCLTAVTAGLGNLPAQTEKTRPAKDAPLVTSSTVVYRSKAADPWTTFGYYNSEASARRVFEHLARTGYLVKLEITNAPIPKLPPRPPSVALPVEETYSIQKIEEVFRWMAKQREIAFAFPIDGCYARAHLMCDKM